MTLRHRGVHCEFAVALTMVNLLNEDVIQITYIRATCVVNIRRCSPDPLILLSPAPMLRYAIGAKVVNCEELP